MPKCPVCGKETIVALFPGNIPDVFHKEDTILIKTKKGMLRISKENKHPRCDSK